MRSHWLVFLLIILVSLYGCSNTEMDLDSTTRIDIEFTTGENKMIIEEDTINLCTSIWKKIQWNLEEGKPEEMEPVKLTLFILTDKDMPERLYEYSIWFTEAGAIILDHETASLGRLELDSTVELKKILENYSKPGV
ncbi:hypothetical protein [Paucisalibacillus sp. EB02]|uniref:hypothetical protein n=1 Tax=Paucisalibacillus sp. EB02 TaxID=1347087 RepID=UPI0006950CE2|nr:hypothetical protein [Paucisalibacillus sp. EB02]